MVHYINMNGQYLIEYRTIDGRMPQIQKDTLYSPSHRARFQPQTDKISSIYCVLIGFQDIGKKWWGQSGVS